MNKFSIRSTLNLTGFQLRNSKKTIIGWTIAIMGIMSLYMFLFPTMKDIAEVKMETMPEEIMSLFGMEDLSSMNNYIGYFGMIYNIILIPLSIFGAIFGAGLVYKEEKNKTIEFINSMPVKRSEIYLANIITGIIGLTIVLIGAIAVVGIAGIAVGGNTFDLMDYITVSKVSSITPYFFMFVAIGIAGMTAKINVPVIASMVVLADYMVGYLGKLLEEKIPHLSSFSPFEVFNPAKVVDLDNELIVQAVIYLAIGLIFMILGKTIYNKRDLKL
ncbi:MAG: ABC transporter permease subunit [Anaerovoracaceae bacterium]